MTTEQKLDLVINELIEKSPNIFMLNQKNKVSSILLFKDYIFRLRLWKERLNVEYTKSFGLNFNISVHYLMNDINVSWKEEMLPVSNIKSYLVEEHKIQLDKDSRVYNYFFIYLFLYWEVFKNREGIAKDNDLPHPYEGIIKMFRNDNIFRFEGINIAHVTMRHSSCINLRLPSIEDDFLNYIDSKCKLSGSAGIPNQEEVNQLWENFKK